MKVSWNIDPQKLVKNIEKNVKASAPKIVDAVSKEIEVNAKRNFNRAIPEIGADNPYIVVSRVVNGNSATIRCIGEQVLFAEFGAGLHNSYFERTITIDNYTRGNFSVKGYDRTIVFSARGFSKGGMKELMPRPSGIVQLGKYGKGYGVNEYWVRPTTNGRLASRETNVHKRNGEMRNDVIWTMGTKPVRALWRARNTALNKLFSGRLNIK